MHIKQIPEDFIVREVASIPFSDSGEYSYFLLRKKDWNTMDAVREIALKLGIDTRRIRYGGIKDKQAVTEQYISIHGVDKVRIEALQIKDIELKHAGNCSLPMSSEMLSGNGFKITLRGLENKIPVEPKLVPNYFDEQRFGFKAKNHLAGKALVQKDFSSACKLMGLDAKGNDFVAALMAKRDLMVLCFNAYQSYLFNIVLAEYVRKHGSSVVEVKYNAGVMAFGDLSKAKNIALPLVHFDTEFENDEIKRLYEKVMKEEGIRLSDFLIRQLPNLVQTSPSRMAFVAVKDYKVIEYSNDELNEGMKKEVISFSLPKGSYGTVVVKWMEAAK